METRFCRTTSGASDKVFVGSIPGYFREEDVRAVFAPYGQITAVRINFKADNPQLNRGFCILTMREPLVAARLIHTKQIHIGNGRYVICKPYLQGQQLQEEIVRHDLRRVILKQLPADMGEEEIKTSLEAVAGPVEVVFVFESDERCPQNTQVRRVRTASVTFYCPQQAQSLFPRPELHERYILLQGKPIKIQKFRYQQPTKGSSPTVSDQDVEAIPEPRPPTVRRGFISQPCPVSQSQPAQNGRTGLGAQLLLDHSVSNLRFNVRSVPAATSAVASLVHSLESIFNESQENKTRVGSFPPASKN